MPALDMDAAESLWARRYGEPGSSHYLDALKSCLEAVKGRARVALDLRYGAGVALHAQGRSSLHEFWHRRPGGVTFRSSACLDVERRNGI